MARSRGRAKFNPRSNKPKGNMNSHKPPKHFKTAKRPLKITGGRGGGRG